MIEVKEHKEGLDIEWLRLILEAKKLGIQKEELREFLKKGSIGELKQ